MRVNQLKGKIERNEAVYGLFVSIPHPIVIEMIGNAEFDFVIIDYEHGSLSLESIEQMIRAAELLNITPLVRISDVHRTDILKLLDSGAQGIVIPHVEHKQQVEEAVQHTFYYPIGKRSLNSGRSAAFSKYSLTEYIARANNEMMIVPMIESVQGVKQSESILSVPQVSFVLEGAGDLSQSLAIPWETEHPKVQEQLERVYETALRCHVPYAVVSRNEENHKKWAKCGVNIFVLGDDRSTAFRSYYQLREQYQRLTGEGD